MSGIESPLTKSSSASGASLPDSPVVTPAKGSGGASLPGSPVVVTPAKGGKKRQQQDIRHFFTPSPGSTGQDIIYNDTRVNPVEAVRNLWLFYLDLF